MVGDKFALFLIFELQVESCIFSVSAWLLGNRDDQETMLMRFREPKSSEFALNSGDEIRFG